jgi:formate/nitrite transporter FocA (FNT family)
MAWLVVSSGALDAEPVRNTALRITEAKLALPMGQAFCKGVLANVLVCLAIWLAMSASSVPGKVIPASVASIRR